jgi:ADP-ribose pyrophosphatase
MTNDSSTSALPEIRIELLEELDDAAPGFMSLHRRRLRARYPDGSQSPPFVYDSVSRRLLDAVVIAAFYERGGATRVFLRSAVRPPVGYRDPARSAVPERGTASLWELPAGLVELDEETSLAGVARSAQRELMEELGFDVELDRLQPLGPSTFPAPGFIAERHFFYAVRVDPALRGEPSLDGSPLERGGIVIDIPLEEALAMCRRGEIEDEKTELGLRRLEEHAR